MGSAQSDLSPAFAMPAAVYLKSGRFDPAPTRAKPLAPVNSGRSAIYEKTLDTPRETRSIAAIIPPIASRIDGVFLLIGRRLVP